MEATAIPTLVQLSELKARDDNAEYHAQAYEFLQQQAKSFIEHRKTGDPGTWKSDRTFFTHHFNNLRVTDLDQVERYYKEKGLSVATVRGYYGKLRVFLTYVRESESTMLFKDVEDEYKRRGVNLGALATHKSKEKELPTTMDHLLKQCNALSLSKVPPLDYFALKLVCYFSLRGDPGHIKLRDYDESRDLYVKDGKIHLRIIVKDKREKYKDVHMVYTMTPEEKTAMDQFIKDHPDRKYLFTSQSNSTLHQRNGNFNTRVQRSCKRWFGAPYGVTVIRKMVQTKYASMMSDRDGLDAAESWYEYARNRGHALRTVFDSYVYPTHASGSKATSDVIPDSGTKVMNHPANKSDTKTVEMLLSLLDSMKKCHDNQVGNDLYNALHMQAMKLASSLSG
ncbi:hypothetical protein GGF32_006490 [Allomyces javanicus]|nr:hypothetical protein GGF32_006490 [Allomyces javanicus]